MSNIVSIIAGYFLNFGYVGIGIMMLLEASFIPFPSEVAMIPAGIFAAKGQMNIFVAIIIGVLGSLLGSSVNYILGRKFGREFLYKYGKYLFLNHKKLDEMDLLFKDKGPLITFLGRLVPVVRQYISFPAGISKMNYFKFILYTGLGSGIWCTILAYLGFYYGNNQDKINSFILKFKVAIIIVVILLVAYYIYWKFFSKKVSAK
ncbi:MAG: DedA family protein [Fusobacteriaceae bacterium]